MASPLPGQKGKEISLLLLGKTGHGKSATGNTILGRDAFAMSDSSRSETKVAQLDCSQNAEDTLVRVVDTPGVMDTEEQEDSIFLKIMEGMSLCPNGFHALVFVIKYGIRFTKEEKDSSDILKSYFGSNFLKDFGIIVMTHGDSFDLIHEDDGLTFEQWLMARESEEGSQTFVDLLKECNNRCVLFNNNEDEDLVQRERCVEELFSVVEKIPKVYTSKHVELATQLREDVVAELRTPTFHTVVQEKISLMVEQIVQDMGNNTFSSELMSQKFKALRDALVVKGGYSKETVELKEKLHSMLQKIDSLSVEDDREKQLTAQQKLLEKLYSLRGPTINFKTFLARNLRGRKSSLLKRENDIDDQDNGMFEL